MNTFDYLLEENMKMKTTSREGGSIVVQENSSQKQNKLSSATISLGLAIADFEEELIVVDKNLEAFSATDNFTSTAVGSSVDNNVLTLGTAASSSVADGVPSLSTGYIVPTDFTFEEISEDDYTSYTTPDTKDSYILSLYENGVTLKGAQGNDTIVVIGGNKQTLVGGAGSDTYKVFSDLSSGTVITIDQKGAATTDVDRLQLSRVSKNDVTFSRSGSDLVIKHANGGELVIAAWTDHALDKISFNDGVLKADEIKALTQTDAGSGATTALGVIQSFMKTLDDTTSVGFTAVDEAVSACSNGLYSSLSDVVNAFVADCTKNSGSTVAERKAFLKKYCGIDLDNTDTGAITGSDAGGSVTKTAKSVVDEGTATLNDFKYDRSKYTTLTTYDNSARALGTGSVVANVDFYSTKVNGVTFYWNESNWSSLGVDTKVLEQIMGGVLNSWLGASMELIDESYGMTLDEEGNKLRNYKYTSGTNAVQIVLDYNENSSTVAAVWSAIGSSGSGNSAKTLYATEVLVINTAYFRDTLKDVDGSSRYSSVGSLDRIIAHEITHGVMAADVNMYSKLPVFLKEGLAELVHGADDTRTSEMLELCNTNYKGYWSVDGVSTSFNQTDLLSAIFNLTNASTNVGTETYAAGYMLLRYLAQQVANASSSSEEVSSSNMITNMGSIDNAIYTFGDGGVSDVLNAYSTGSYEIVKIYSSTDSQGGTYI